MLQKRFNRMLIFSIVTVILFIKFVPSTSEPVNCCTCIDLATDTIKQEAEVVNLQCSAGTLSHMNDSNLTDKERITNYLLDAIDIPALIGMLSAIARNESTYMESWNRTTLQLENKTFWEVISRVQNNFLTSFEYIFSNGTNFKRELDNLTLFLNKIPKLIENEDFVNLTAELNEVEKFQDAIEKFKGQMKETERMSFNHDFGMTADLLGLKIRTQMDMWKSGSLIKSLEIYLKYSQNATNAITITRNNLIHLYNFYHDQLLSAYNDFRRMIVSTNRVFFHSFIAQETTVNYEAIFDKIMNKYYDNLDYGIVYRSPEFWSLNVVVMVNKYLDNLKHTTANDSKITYDSVVETVGMCNHIMRLAMDSLKKPIGSDDQLITNGINLLLEVANICSDAESLIDDFALRDEAFRNGLLTKINKKQAVIEEFLSTKSQSKYDGNINKAEILQSAKGMSAEYFKANVYEIIKQDLKRKLNAYIQAVRLNQHSLEIGRELLQNERNKQTMFVNLYQKVKQSICLANEISTKATSVTSFLKHLSHKFDEDVKMIVKELNQTAFMLIDTLTQKNNYTKIFLTESVLDYVKQANYTLMENAMLFETYLNMLDKYILGPLMEMQFTFLLLDITEPVIQRSLTKIYFNYCRDVKQVRHEVKEMIRIKDEEFNHATNSTKPEEDLGILFELFGLKI